MSDDAYTAAVRACAQRIAERMPARVADWHGLLSGHDPSCGSSRAVHGLAIRYVDALISEQPCYMLTGTDAAPLCSAAIVAVRDAGQVHVCYVAGWRDARESPEQFPDTDVDSFVVLHPVPALDGWQLPAGRAFHVEVS